MGAFGLEGDDHWRAPFKTKAAVQQRLSREGAEGLFIDAPARVPLDGRTELPIVGCRVVSLRDARAVSFDRGAIVAALHLDEGRLHAALVEPPRNRDPSVPAPEPDETDPGEGRFYRMFTVDAHARLPDLPWRKGTIITTLLLRGQRSERARSELVTPTPRGWIDPVALEAAKAAEAKRAMTPRAPALRKVPGASYRKEARSPQPPDAPGVALLAPKRAQAKGELVVRGTFQVPLLEWQKVGDTPVGDPEAKAVVPVGLLLAGERVAGPFVLDLAVPLHELPAEGKPARGHFMVDLLKTDAMSHRTRQRYWLWAFAGEALAGPYEVDLA
jgi:hypothetical protein